MLAWFDRAHHERFVFITLESLPIATVQWAWLPQGCVIVLTLWVADFDSWQYRVSMLPALGSVENPLFV